ncbi:MAG: copper oxidase [Gemmatimonadales bacterium]|nr:MAG: copper oxidase [Gemmatimonadales bacterium]
MGREFDTVSRREFLHASGAVLALFTGLERLLPAYARPGLGTAAPATRPVGGTGSREFDLRIGRTRITIGEREAWAQLINGTLPGPLLRFREGETVTLRVSNALDEDTSIHWHGLIVPNGMDGVPKVTFDGIRPGETFTYRFPVRQSGTYWYHSHSGLQEQMGVYGPIIIDPIEPDPFEYEREYVVVLSDWTFEDPHDVLAKLKKMGGYYNFQRRTVAELIRDAKKQGLWSALGNRLSWGRMRMDPTDLSDVTGYTYTYLMNGMPPGANWTALFRPGERVRLRFINAAASSFFDVRIPDLPMTVVQADGQNVHPVTVDEFRIAIAETYDVIVQPLEDRAYTIFAESMDRSGYARGTLAPRPGMSAEIPKRRPRPVRTMADMGMDMSGMEMSEMQMEGMHAHAGHAMPASSAVPHGPDRHGPGNSAVRQVTRPRLDDPGVGLGEDGRRVLVYRDLRAVVPSPDQREPIREIELHLTGNMERYMWSFDGKKFSEAPEPIPVGLGERVRITFVNDTMMEHPIHLHGMWMELDNGAGDQRPRKHTVNVKPAERLSVLVTPDVPGKWALHCHILYHMEAGMFRVVEVAGGLAEEDR